MALSRFPNEQTAPSPEMAIRLDKAFGAHMETLMRTQGSYDFAQARQWQGEIRVDRYEAVGRDPHPEF